MCGALTRGRTPQDLIVDGLYTALAVAAHPGPFWAVSVALVAKALGAHTARRGERGEKEQNEEKETTTAVTLAAANRYRKQENI